MNTIKISKIVITLLLLLSTSSIIFAQTVFTHQCKSSNTKGHITYLNNPALNNNPNAIIIVTQEYGTYNANEVGVWYTKGKWTIFNQNRKPMPKTAKFNVLVFKKPTSQAFVHTTSRRNISKHITTLNSSQLNNKKNAVVLVTQRYGKYNTSPVGIWYNQNKWKIYNEQTSKAMPAGTKFNVVVLKAGQRAIGSLKTKILRHQVSPTSKKKFRTKHVSYTKHTDKKAKVFITQRYARAYNPHTTGVWFNSGKWTVINQDKKEIPNSTTFNIVAITTSNNKSDSDELIAPIIFTPTVTLAPLSASKTTNVDGGKVVQTLMKKTNKPSQTKITRERKCPETGSGVTCTTQQRRFEDATIDHFLKKSNSVIEAPGNVINGNDLFNGRYVNVKANKRKPYKIFINSNAYSRAGLRASREELIENPNSQSAISRAISNLQGYLPTTDTQPMSAILNVYTIESETDAKLKIGGSFSSPWVDVKTIFDFRNSSKTKKYLLEYTAVYYTMNFERVGSNSFFDESVKIDNNWIYVDQVKYGKRYYFSLESEESVQEIENQLEVSGEYGAIKVGFDLNRIQTNEHRNTRIKQIVQGGNIIPIHGSFPNNIINQLAQDRFSRSNPGVPISSQFRFVSNNEIAQAVTTADYTERVCFRTSNVFKVKIENIFCQAQDDNGSESELFGKVDMWVENERGERYTAIDGNFSGTRAWQLTEDQADDYGIITTNAYLPINKFQFFKIPTKELQYATLVIKGELYEEDAGGDDNLGIHPLKIPLKNILKTERVGSISSSRIPGQIPAQSPVYTDGDGIQRFYLQATIEPIVPEKGNCGN